MALLNITFYPTVYSSKQNLKYHLSAHFPHLETDTGMDMARYWDVTLSLSREYTAYTSSGSGVRLDDVLGQGDTDSFDSFSMDASSMAISIFGPDFCSFTVAIAFFVLDFTTV